MCTAISFLVKDHYFGRNLDLYYSYDEQITVTPRNFPLRFRMTGGMPHHYSIIGMATVADGYPLYYEATNEKGLSIAGLNFPDNGVYRPPISGKDNIAPFELVPWILGDCATLLEVKQKLKNINIVNISFNDAFPITPLHWLISDKNSSIVLESRADGVKLFDNPLGVLTNNPPFEMQSMLLQNYIQLSSGMPENRFSQKLQLKPYSLGMGAIGLPGDLSSPSRFVRAAFAKLNSVCEEDESSALAQFFHILGAVSQPRGLAKTKNGELEHTLYSCCINTDKGIYYYTTYQNQAISAVDMKKEDLNGHQLIKYPLMTKQRIVYQN